MEIKKNFNMAKVDIQLVTQHKLFPIGTRLITQENFVFRYSLDSDGYKWISENRWDKVVREWGAFFDAKH